MPPITPVQDPLKKAIYDRCKADSVLVNCFGPQTAWQISASQMPIIILVQLNGPKHTAGFTKATYIEPTVFRFTVFSLTEDVCETIMQRICDLFDYKKFTVTGQEMLACRRISGSPNIDYVPASSGNKVGSDIACFRGVVTFEFDMQKIIGS